ncbi:hypothetical protein [Halalkalibacter akibai]|uniref:DUF8052 domain-containing protein n=1 Tax=Halalkalibacter akibai (strain ATCC 43226 / DSM 21942 / CIP 109018 / JCM 9157 / 1139) TaxID=1236973 RepID=W4QQE6_HALA3|nr:hypothetical protein [Halalkalibacter akibai]GAE33554.1 hypothetical protein JCM9157_560 [Halalkalibacter akibai JCM 9157]
MTGTKIEKFMNEIANRYTIQFNVYRDECIGTIPLNFYAEFQRRDEKYLMSKSIKVWGVEVQQYAFVTTQETVNRQFLDDFARQIDDQIPSFVSSKQDHMTTYFVGIIVTNESVSKEIQKQIKRLRKIKFLRYGLHGWADRYMAIVSLKDKQVYVHNKGREFLTGFEAALEKEEAKL